MKDMNNIDCREDHPVMNLNKEIEKPLKNMCTIEDEKNKRKHGSLGKQLLYALIINTVSLLQGASISTSSIILHHLQGKAGDIVENATLSSDTDTTPIFGDFFEDFSVTPESGSWIASSWVLGHLISACFTGFLTDTIGRKKSLLIDTTFFFIGSIILCTSSSPTFLVIARFLHGYPLVSQVYLCEILSPSRRGLGAAMYSVLHSCGFFLVLILGAFLPWRLAVAIPAFLAVPSFISILFIHESPEWLCKKGKMGQCKAALAFYQTNLEQVDASVDKEINQKKQITEVKDKTTPKEHEENYRISLISLLSFVQRLKCLIRALLLDDPFVFKNIFLLSLMFFLLGWNGFSILSFYAVEIFQLSGSPLSAVHTSWIVSTTKIACSIVSFYVLHKFDRKSLLFLTGSLVCLSFLTIGLFTFLSNISFLSPATQSSLSFVPMFCVILAYTGYSLGFSVIPNLVAAEILPVRIRSSVVGILMSLEMTSTFALSKLKPLLMEGIGIHGLFTLFAGAVLIVIILTMFALPNSKIMDKENGKKCSDP